MKVYLDTIGCRLNQSEIETMARQLLANGHEVVDDAAAADTVILNTCAVTHEAARDARKLTRRFHRANPAANIVLTGCYATIAPQELERLDGVSQVVANQHKTQLIQLLDPQARLDLPIFDQEPLVREFMGGSLGHTRAFIKVQDGCNNKCTFCVTTIARGEGVSRHLGDVVAEIQALAGAGYQEAVLTGVHMGSYGHDFGNKTGLRDLVQAILTHTDIPRLRLSSLEPWDIAPHFFALWQNPRLLPHLHLPLQSGSDRVLKRMARRTNQVSFGELVHAARTHIPGLNLSTDLIVGFPGETEEEFAETLAFVRTMNFTRLHVFSYSARPGTAAANMPHHIAEPTKKERTHRLIQLGHELSLAFHQQHEEQVVNVLWENNIGANEEGLLWAGYTDNYIRVQANGPADLTNKVLPTRLHSARPEGLSGVIL